MYMQYEKNKPIAQINYRKNQKKIKSKFCEHLLKTSTILQAKSKIVLCFSGLLACGSNLFANRGINSLASYLSFRENSSADDGIHHFS